MALKDIEKLEHSVEIEEFHRVHVWIWRLQYVFMALVILIAALTLAGLFGDGWLSRAKLTSAGASVSYQRFARFGKETLLQVGLPAGDRSVGLPLAYFERFKLDAVVPQPSGQRLEGNRVVFEFDAAGKTTVRFHLLPRRPGVVEAVITAGGVSFDLAQFTWP